MSILFFVRKYRVSSIFINLKFSKLYINLVGQIDIDLGKKSRTQNKFYLYQALLGFRSKTVKFTGYLLKKRTIKTHI